MQRWGEGLTRDARDELRAAGRAILLLVDEVEQLNGELSRQRASSTESSMRQATVGHPEVEAHERATLRDRIVASAARAID